MTGVTVVCPNNHRVNVKFDGSIKTLFQILDEACKRQGYVPEKYGLKHHDRFVDLSLTFRMSGLPQNCTLEMAELPESLRQQQMKKDTEDVQLALQLADGQRLMGTVPSDATLLDVLLDLEKSNSMRLVEPEGDNMQPVCYYLQNEFVGSLALATTTLRQLGIRGRALFRYVARQVEPAKLKEINENIERSQAKMQKLEVSYEKKLQDNLKYEQELQRRQQEAEALEQLRQQNISEQAAATEGDVSSITCSATESVPSVSLQSPQESVSDRQARLDALQSMLAMVDQSIEEGTELPWQPQQVQVPLDQVQVPPDQVPQPSARNFVEFKFPEETKGLDLLNKSMGASSRSDVGAVQPCERRAVAFSLADVEEVTSEEPPPEFYDVTVDDVKAQLRAIKDQTEERVLLPESYVKQKEFERKMVAWKITVVRIRMPDRTVLQAAFRTMEKVSALYKFVEENLNTRHAQFQLCLPPNIALDKLDHTLLQAGLAPRATLLYKHKAGSVSFSDSNLSSGLLDNIKSPLEADRIAEECLSENASYVPYRPPPISDHSQRPQPMPPGDYDRSSSGTGRTDPMPKWLTKGKK